MSLDLTRITSKALDITRNLLYPPSVKLVVLKISEAGGYNLDVQVPSGWVLLPSDEDRVRILIHQTSVVTRDVLEHAAAFGFYSPNRGLVDSDHYWVYKKLVPKAPVFDALTLWEFQCSNIDEVHP